jgi:hypothetical protein
LNGNTKNGAFNAASDHGYSYGSTDTEQVWGASRLLVDHILTAIPDDKKPEGFFGLTAGEIKKLYHDIKSASERDDRLWDVREHLKDLSMQQVAALMQIEDVRGMLRTGAHIMAERNQQN